MSLSSQARVILAALPLGPAGPFPFSSDGGARPVSGFSKAKARLDRALARHLGRPGWCMTCAGPWATHMERIGVPPHVIEVCLGHVLKGVEGTCRQYAYLPEKAVALQRWADKLLTGSKDTLGVTQRQPKPA